MFVVTRIWRTPAFGIGALFAFFILGCGGSNSENAFLSDRVVDDRISTSDPFDGGTYYQAFRVKAVASGEGIINMEGGACTNCEEDSSTTVDTELFVKRLNGDAVAEDNDPGGGSDARIRFPIGAGDEFRVVATTHKSEQTGGYRLTVSENLRIVGRLDH